MQDPHPVPVLPKDEIPIMGPWPYFAPDEIEAVTHVLTTGKVNYWTGDEGRKFEQEYADFVGSRHAVAVANGTVSLELALYCLGIGPGDEVVVPPRTFIATASAVVARGATPVLADVDRDSGNITAESIERVLSSKTRAVICVHLAGWPCEMDALLDLVESKNLYLIEDCAQAHGASYRGRAVGSFGQFGSFSFCQDKILTTGGEGGLVTTDDTELFKTAWSYKDHGKGYDAVYHHEHPPGFRWVHESFGTNWRMTEMQSALGRVILRKLPGWVESRRRNAAILDSYVEGAGALRPAPPPAHLVHSYYKYYLYVEPAHLKTDWNRDRIQDEIIGLGVPTFSGSCSEIYLEKAFGPELRPPQPLPVAQELGRTSLMFQVHPTLSEDYLHYAGTQIRSVLDRALR
ncbi:MAG: DegT/DnrJ/EryC1/StrS family aminotransferase [Vulcanimicrobiota bacterium]